jgi:hypothetical protein
MCCKDFEAYFFQYHKNTHDSLLTLIMLPHKIHINCHITIMGAFMELLPQPPDKVHRNVKLHLKFALFELTCAPNLDAH